MTGFLKRVLIGLFFLTTTPAIFAQGGEIFEGKEIIDTVKLSRSTIVLFADQTWMFISEPGFDGVMNEYLHDIVSDTTLNFKTHWHTDMPFTYDNDIHRLRDTIWMCTVDSTFNKFCMPVKGEVISKFKYRGSRFHHGVDIDLKIGDTVRAAFAGKVRYAQYNRGGFGNLVIIRHYNGIETYYAHLSKINVMVDQDIQAGEVLGLGGKTGRAYGPHLHFETRFYDHAFDPYEIIDFDNKRLKSENLFIHAGMFDYKAVSRKNTTGASYVTNTPDRKTPNKVGTPPPANGNSKFYTVRSGDNLYVIAKRHGTTIDNICQLNGITRDDILKIGQRLRVR